MVEPRAACAHRRDATERDAPLTQRASCSRPSTTGRRRVRPAASRDAGIRNRRGDPLHDRKMANAYPVMVRCVHDEGNKRSPNDQSQTCTPSPSAGRRTRRRRAKIEGGSRPRRALRSAIPMRLLLSFVFPVCCGRTSVEHILAAHGVMTRSVDVVADDGRILTPARSTRAPVSRLEARGKGVLPLPGPSTRPLLQPAGDPPGSPGARPQDRLRGAGGAGPGRRPPTTSELWAVNAALGARTLAARGRHRDGDVRAGIDGAEPGEPRRRRSSGCAVRGVLGARCGPEPAAAPGRGAAAAGFGTVAVPERSRANRGGTCWRFPLAQCSSTRMRSLAWRW